MPAFFFWNKTMTDYLKVNLANWNDRAAIHIKDEAGGYRVKEFLNGDDNLHGIEDREIGDVRGKRIAHLQCHFGIDTLCLARRGAILCWPRLLARRHRRRTRLAKANRP